MTIIHSFFNPSSRWYYPLRWLVLILLGLAIYAQTFGFGFEFDDLEFIVHNYYITRFNHVHYIWQAFPQTRTIGFYSFAFNYLINQLHPQGYHIFNFVVHLLAVGLVWAVAGMLFKISKIPEDPLTKEFPFIIALLFLVHPGQTQAVTYIYQRFELMATVFYIGSIYFYLCGRTASLTIHKIFLFTCSIGFAIIGLFTKEVAATIPLMILAAELIFFNENRRRTIILTVGGFFFLAAFIKLARVDFNFFFQYHPFPSQSHDGDMITTKGYLLTQMRVFLTFIRLLILPIRQNLDYDYPLSTGFLHPSLTLAGTFLIGATILLLFKLRKKYPIIAFGLAWILITFSINLAPRANVISEHKIYLISFGFFLTLVSALFIVIRRRILLVGFLITLIAGLSLSSFLRNQVWKNELTLWDDTVRKSPHKARPHYNRGLAYYNLGDFSQALLDYNMAIEINPDLAAAYTRRGKIYDEEGKFTQALSNYNKAVEIDPNIGGNYYNRGLVFAQQGHFTQAMLDFNKAIKINPENAEAYINRGVIFSQQSGSVQALSDYNKAIEIDPNAIEAYTNRGTLYARQGSFTQALSDYNKAISLDHGFARAYYNRAVSYYQLKEYDKAWSDVSKAEELGTVVNPEFMSGLQKASGKDK